jgi:hypothetical protein
VAFNKGLAVRAVFPDEKPATLFKDIEDVCMIYANKFMESCNSLFPSDKPQYFYGFSLTKLSTDIQLRIHQDVHGEFSSLSYSGVLYLNDDYEGGHLLFHRQEVKITLGHGDVIVFPSGYTHPHEVTPVTKGTRKTIVTWLS